MTPGTSNGATLLRAALLAAALGAVAAGVAAVLAHRDSERGFTHTVGVFVVLAELLRDGVFYPHAQDPALVYATFYHPLAFAPIALLPGTGIELVPPLRLLVGAEALLCAGLAAWLARTPLAAVLALGCVPVAHGLLGMRDDPRATWLCLLALVAGARRPRLAGALLAVAVLTKATAPVAPALALAVAAARADRGAFLRFAAAGALTTAALVAYVQWGLGADLLGNGLRWGWFEPARAARTWSEAFAKLGSDLGRDLATPALLLAATAAAVARLRRDPFAALVLAAWAKTVLVYRSPGTDLNHLFDLCVYAVLLLARACAPSARASLAAAGALLFAVALSHVIGLQPASRVLFPPGALPPLSSAPALANVAALRAADPVAFTLCEDPFTGWLLSRSDAGGVPASVVHVDPYLTLAALRHHPAIRRRWFGEAGDPFALRRVLLLRDPAAPGGREWYERVHFDPELITELEARWTKALVSGNGTVFVR
jgi:hypothetical protein